MSSWNLQNTSVVYKANNDIIRNSYVSKFIKTELIRYERIYLNLGLYMAAVHQSV